MANTPKIEPRNPKGMRDFLPAQKRVRDAVLKKMIEVFESYGFDPLETPPVELKETLTGKTGAEEKLIYDVTYKGDKELALRYDLTVPLARVVGQYPDLPKPFKRYQIGNSYRAENTQKGRFRQFLQVDIDVVGSDSPLSEVEVIECAIRTYQKLGLKVKILINSRTLLLGKILEAGVSEEKKLAVAGSIDKVGKIGKAGVIAELEEKGLSDEQANQVFSLIKNSQPDIKLETLFNYLSATGLKKEEDFIFDPFLARGLDYYTETVFEADAEGYDGGSVGGGGRYDNLIQSFSGSATPAIGFSFGFDRILESMTEQNTSAKEVASTKVLVTVFDDRFILQSLKLSNDLRNSVPTELYTGSGDLDKQLKYADQKGIPFAVIVGPKEAELGQVTIKNLGTTEQKTVPIDQAASILLN